MSDFRRKRKGSNSPALPLQYAAYLQDRNLLHVQQKSCCRRQNWNTNQNLFRFCWPYLAGSQWLLKAAGGWQFYSTSNHLPFFLTNIQLLTAYVCVCVCVYAFVFVWICICVCVCVCMCVCMCTCIHMCTCVCLVLLWALYAPLNVEDGVLCKPSL